VMERIGAARPAERYRGTADLPFHYRPAHGPGWALVGDAGHCKDPILARGITDAFHDAESLASALVDGLSGSAPLEPRLAERARDRDASTRDLYDFTYRLSLLQGTSERMMRVYRAARTDPAIASRFHGVITGAVAYRDFFEADDVRALLDGCEPAASAP